MRYSGCLDILTNIPLAPFTTFGIGGPARWYAKAASEADLAEAVAWAGERGVALFVLGGGSNLLVSDNGFNGLALHVAAKGIQQEGSLFQCGAGEDWDAFVSLAIGRGFAGVECLAGIPGTVGGTPVQNVGAYGQEVSSVIERVRAFDQVDRTFVELTNAGCGFAYRRSRFNSTDRGRFIVSRVDYRLIPGGAPQLSYADLKLHFQHRAGLPSLHEVAAAVRSIRQSKGMLIVEGDPDCHSAGSFFKNPTVQQDVANRIRQMAAALNLPLRVFPAADGQVKIPAAWLIEQAGFPKGYVMGNAGISSRHTLALINRSGASADEILALAKQISEAVQSKFNVQLEIEPVLLGFENA
jgi:UDP-N-acetylmuramate dehydrogenase